MKSVGKGWELNGQEEIGTTFLDTNLKKWKISKMYISFDQILFLRIYQKKILSYL